MNRTYEFKTIDAMLSKLLKSDSEDVMYGVSELGMYASAMIDMFDVPEDWTIEMISEMALELGHNVYKTNNDSENDIDYLIMHRDVSLEYFVSFYQIAEDELPLDISSLIDWSNVHIIDDDYDFYDSVEKDIHDCHSPYLNPDWTYTVPDED